MPNTTLTVTTTPKPIPSLLGRDLRQKLTLSLPAAATAEIYTGDAPDITTSTGLPLYPGEERTYEGDAARRDYHAVTPIRHPDPSYRGIRVAYPLPLLQFAKHSTHLIEHRKPNIQHHSSLFSTSPE